MTLPNLRELNDAGCGQTTLLLLRALNTSDLSFHYMLLKPDTLRDQVRVHRDLLADCKEELSTAEMLEAEGYLSDMEEGL